jgi:hypothetical protein
LRGIRFDATPNLGRHRETVAPHAGKCPPQAAFGKAVTVEGSRVEVAYAKPQRTFQRIARFVVAHFRIQIADRRSTEAEARDPHARTRIRTLSGACFAIDTGFAAGRVNRHDGDPWFDPGP